MRINYSELHLGTTERLSGTVDTLCDGCVRMKTHRGTRTATANEMLRIIYLELDTIMHMPDYMHATQTHIAPTQTS